MFKPSVTLKTDPVDRDIDFEFWPKQAADYLNQGEFKKTIELCEQNLSTDSKLLSGRIIYVKALNSLNRYDEAVEQLYHILSIDPDHLVSLKMLGDIHFEKHDVVSAMANYSRVLEIDPNCGGLHCTFEPKQEETQSALILVKGREPVLEPAATSVRSPFTTETVADLYMKQGQPRLALAVLKELLNGSQDNRLTEKITAAEKMISQKERRDIEPAD